MWRLQLLSSDDRLRVPDNARANLSIEAMERQMWNAVPTTGVLQLSFDPATGARRSIFMNQVLNPKHYLAEAHSARDESGRRTRAGGLVGRAVGQEAARGFSELQVRLVINSCARDAHAIEVRRTPSPFPCHHRSAMAAVAAHDLARVGALGGGWDSGSHPSSGITGRSC